MADFTSPPDAEQQTARQRQSRRGFLRTAGGVAAGTALFIAGCDGDSIPENQQPTATLTVGGLDDNAQDDLNVTFTAEYGDPDVEGQDAFDDEISSARIEISNGDVLELAMEDGTSTTVDYAFNSRGQYTATLIVEDNFGGRATDSQTFVVGAMAVTLDFSNDFGVLNYAYALEQLEAAFYAQGVAALDDGSLSFDDVTEEYFRDVAQHEAIHRDFLGAALADNAIPNLVPDFSSVTFSDPASVLGTAQVLEDTGVSAYNGAADLLDDPGFLTLAGKIVSVEARHASAIRALIGGDGDPTNFADLTELTDFGADPDNALDALQSPADVLAAAGGFISTPINPTGL